MNHEGVIARGGRLAATLLVAGAPLVSLPTVAQTEPPAKVQVSGFQVTGNTLIDTRWLDAVLLPLIGQRSLDELHRAAARVQALYAEQGFGAVVAYLPPQNSQGGLITIAVVEGKIRDIKVSGASRFSDDNVRGSLPALQLGSTPRLRDIDAELRIANENPAKKVQVLLKPGALTGEAVADLTVKERPLQHVSAGVDNTGNSRTGEYRASLGWQHASLSGHDDVLGGQLQFSPTELRKVVVASAGYRLPLYRQHLVLDAFAAYSDVDGGTSASVAGDLRFVGRGRVLGAKAGWYLQRWGDLDPRVSFGIDRRAYLNRCDIAGLPSGSCGPAGESVTVTPMSLELQLQSGGAAPFGAALSLHRNLGFGGSHTDEAAFEAARPAARRNFTVARASVHGGLALSDDWLLRGRLSLQWTPDALVSGEQFGLGGAQSVRGYEERELVGDRGLAASIELFGPALLEGGGWGNLRPLAFVDGGWARNLGDAPCVDVRMQCAAASVGLGVRYELGALNAKVDLAYPLKHASRTQRGDAKAHVALQVGF